jgi:hypothetical protein
MSTKKTPGGKDGRCVWVTTLPPSQCRKVEKIRSLNLPDPQGPAQACRGKTLLFTFTVINMITTSYPLFLSDFNQKWFFSRGFWKPKHQISSKSVTWKSICSMPTERQTDMTKLIVALRNFANASKSAESLTQFSSSDWVHRLALALIWHAFCL